MPKNVKTPATPVSATIKASFERQFVGHVVKCYKDIRTIKCCRDLAWEYCYAEFYKAFDLSPSQINYDLLALHLHAYLGTFGMFRNSYLLDVAYTIHLVPIKKLFQNANGKYRYKPLLGYHWDSTKSNYLRQLNLLFELYDELENEYKKLLGKSPTDTLITKILMGTLGCVPAYDSKVREGIRAANKVIGLWDRIPFSSFTRKSFTKLIAFWECAQSDSDMSPVLPYIVTSSSGWGLLRDPNIKYPLMRIIDIGLWGF